MITTKRDCTHLAILACAYKAMVSCPHPGALGEHLLKRGKENETDGLIEKK